MHRNNLLIYDWGTSCVRSLRGFHLLPLLCLFILSSLFSSPTAVHAEEAICARVKIEIHQEMTFERQAFDAHMNINNGLTSISLENIKVDVLFSDKDGNPVIASSDPSDPDALFFIRVASMSGTDGVDGQGSLAPSSQADIHWLIIPAPESVENEPTGSMFYVGARLQYTINSEEQVTEVTPDYIHVRPLPMLTLDYFLPEEVYGDDPFTEETEPSVPFSLGVRISNNGHGTASNVKIDSAQPKIVENEQGLAVDFKIIGSEVNGIAAPDTLLIEFGDIAPSQSSIGRWLMTTTLSGRFVEFDAEFSHSDELGGELTSLLEEVNTHSLLRDVLVDAPGRDSYRDFLGKDNDILRIYESDAGVTEVVNVSANSAITLQSSTSDTAVYSISSPVISGYGYIQLTDPQGGNKVIKEVLRSDGKIIKPENGWLSKIRVNSNWTYYLNLFDFNTPGEYQVTYIHPSLVPSPPVIPDEEDPVATEGKELILVIEATNQNNGMAALRYRYGNAEDLNCNPAEVQTPTVKIETGRLPVGVTFIDCGDGRAILRWTPTDGQSGNYPISFIATNEQGSTTVRYHLVITDKDNKPTAYFSANTLGGEAPTAVTFSDQSTSEDGITAWYWEFGDGHSSIVSNPEHIYQSAGTYSVSLTVTEIDGDIHTFTRSDYIHITETTGPPGPTGPPVIGPPSLGNIITFLLLKEDSAPATYQPAIQEGTHTGREEENRQHIPAQVQ